MSELEVLPPAQFPEKTSIIGKIVTLIPLNECTQQHLSQLWAGISDSPELFDFIPYGPFGSEEEFLNGLSAFKGMNNCVVYCIISNEVCVGSISYLEIRPNLGVIEIGSVLFTNAMQRTTCGTETVFLLLQQGFERYGYRRIEWKTHSHNLKSQNAALRYGFVFEGIFRQHMF